MAPSRREEIAYHFDGKILWLAYRYSGGDKPEGAYTQGLDMDAKTGGPLYALVRKVLTIDFHPRGGYLFPRFLSCDQVYLDAEMPSDLRVTLLGFFSEINIPVRDITAPIQTPPEVAARWHDALGAPLDAPYPGELRALSIMDAALNTNVEESLAEK